MDLFVLGNINSGKSTFINQLDVDLDVLAIDAHRRTFSDGTIEGEEKTIKRFAEDICKLHSKIIEFSGVGSVTKLLMQQGYNNTCIVVWIDTEQDICIKRIDEKQEEFDKTPYPYKEFDLEGVIKSVQENLETNLVELWEGVSKFVFKSSNCVDALETVKRLLLVAKILDDINEELYDVLIIKGSIPTLTANRHSDIDLLAISDNFEELYSELKQFGAKKVRDKIYFYLEKIFVEIEVKKTFEDVLRSHLAYNGITTFNQHQRRFIELKNDLDIHLAEKDIYCADEQFLMEETDYFISSLHSVVYDQYKYQFHCFIISHNLIRLLMIKKIGQDHNYLPKNVYEVLDENMLCELLDYRVRDTRSQIEIYKKIFKELV